MISRFRDKKKGPICAYCRASRKSYRNIRRAGAEKTSQRPPFPMHPARKADAPQAPRNASSSAYKLCTVQTPHPQRCNMQKKALF